MVKVLGIPTKFVSYLGFSSSSNLSSYVVEDHEALWPFVEGGGVPSKLVW